MRIRGGTPNRMRRDLEEWMNLKEDQVTIVDLGSDEEKARTAATVVGRPQPEPDTGTVVI